MARRVYDLPKDWVVREDDHTIYIAVEGTDCASDWKTNLAFLFGSRDTHRGFRHNAKRILEELFAAEVFLRVDKSKQLILCGHSLGGATATVLMDLLKDTFFNINLVTFGSPRTGKRSLRKRLEHHTHYRYVHGNDIVPKTPPWLCGYVHTHPKIQLVDDNARILDGVEDHSMQNYEEALIRRFEK